jgi:hypothetical protein
MFSNPYWKTMVAMIGGTVVLALFADHYSLVGYGEWVGWIQAVGSVEAIIASVLIAQAQHWKEAQQAEEEKDLEREALVLELYPQLFQLKLWFEERLKLEWLVKNPGNQKIMIPYKDLYPPTPHAFLQSSSTRLLLLPEPIGIRAVQFRELLRMLSDRAAKYMHQSVVIGGVNTQIPEELSGVVPLLETLRTDLNNLYESIDPLYKEIKRSIEDRHQHLVAKRRAQLAQIRKGAEKSKSAGATGRQADAKDQKSVP